MEKLIFLFLVFLISYGCSENSLKKDLPVNLKTELSSEPSVQFKQDSVVKVDYKDSINYTDENGLKQGRWVRKWRGKLIESYNYVNDTLHGHFETEHKEGDYIKGKKEGFEFHYYGEKESILSVSYYENGEFIWSGCPRAGRDYLIPPKNFQIKKDSIHIKAPYINGETWYEGDFCLLPDPLNKGRLSTFSYGVHTVYHMNGNIKGYVDYTNELITEFDSLGNLKYKAKFKERDIHQQVTFGFYKK
ncbi:hypothetical protein [Brumimicrobium mesophilum]|uniref:hypothetical protein n=1 Tax=Brumimicrobium mesophilum TaxID=392717 RepID=UPI000D140382|nr:hypothetical protein [Brumimicrobium mesophilum]